MSIDPATATWLKTPRPFLPPNDQLIVWLLSFLILPNRTSPHTVTATKPPIVFDVNPPERHLTDTNTIRGETHHSVRHCPLGFPPPIHRRRPSQMSPSASLATTFTRQRTLPSGALAAAVRGQRRLPTRSVQPILSQRGDGPALGSRTLLPPGPQRSSKRTQLPYAPWMMPAGSCDLFITNRTLTQSGIFVVLLGFRSRGCAPFT